MPGTVLRAIHGLLYLSEAAPYGTKQAVTLQDLVASEDLERWSDYRSLYCNKCQGKSQMPRKVSAGTPTRRDRRLGRLPQNQGAKGYGRESMDVRVGQTAWQAVPGSTNLPTI